MQALEKGISFPDESLKRVECTAITTLPFVGLLVVFITLSRCHSLSHSFPFTHKSPMSPFKGQGANQALLDALSLARVLYRTPRTMTTTTTSTWSLKEYELEMLQRSAVKVKASADAADFLHSPIAIQPGNCTRGGAAAAAAAAAAVGGRHNSSSSSQPQEPQPE